MAENNKVRFDEWTDRPGTAAPLQNSDRYHYLIKDYQDKGGNHVCICWYPDHTYAWWKFGEQAKPADTLYLAEKLALRLINKEPA
jgi:hypothetical protein